MNFLNGITNLTNWMANVIMPTLAGLFFALAVVRYARGYAHQYIAWSGLMCLGLECICWNPIKFRGATVSMATGFSAGTMVVLVALLSHQPLGVDRDWNKIALAVILGPVVEEVIFRGYCMTAALHLAREWSRTRRNWLAVGGVALIFMLSHGGRPGITTVQLCCIAVTGTLYGVIRIRQQSTFAAVLAHGSYNVALYVAFWVGVSA
jgi:membrane protease YdiL (CAAX protease family)